jgi:hypothetical protein
MTASILVASVLVSRLFLVEKTVPSLERVFERNWLLNRGYVV